MTLGSVQGDTRVTVPRFAAVSCRNSWRLIGGLLTLTVGLAFVGLPVSESRGSTHAQTIETFLGLPLSFEANHGQTDRQVDFIARGRGYTMFLTPREAVLTLRGPATSTDGRRQGQSNAAALRVRLVAANPEPHAAGLEQLPGRVNYFRGKDPTRWRTNIPTYAKVRYREVYPGVDLVYYGAQGQLEYDFILRAGADPERIGLTFEGAGKIEVDTEGDLLLHVAGGAIRHRKPVIYQDVDGARRVVAGGWRLKGAHAVGFRVAPYDTSRPLIIDPVLFYSTYLGGVDAEDRGSIAVDASGYAYVTGETLSADFPTTAGAFRVTGAGPEDVVVTKLDPAGSALVYSTYLGGTGNEDGDGIAVDANGYAYVSGRTSSNDFPTTPGAFQATPVGNIGGTRVTAFVTKLDPSGSTLVYSTYLGGSTNEEVRSIAVDGGGSAYVTGATSSADFPTTAGAFRVVSAGMIEAFVTKVDPSGSTLVYSTYLGGARNDEGYGIAVDADGNAYAIGKTASTDFPTTAGAFRATKPGRNTDDDVYVTKLNPTGTALVYSTYLGGSDNDRGVAIALDAPSNPNAYVTGRTLSTDFPTTAGAFQTISAGLRDVFVSKLDPSGSTLVYSTYLGGADTDEGHGIAVDGAGNAYVAGRASSTNFPITAGAIQTTSAGGRETFVTKLDPSGSTLVYSTYLGGAGDDESTGIAIDTAGSVYLSGTTTSINFPTTSGAFDTTFNGVRDFFVVKLADFGQPATLTLAPNAATNPVNAQHCVTATVQDSAGNPVPGVTVRFSVTGANSAGGPAKTDANGQATFCYTGTNAGQDTISAFADTNNNGTQDPGEPGGTATKTWVSS
jgi:hypothetical protein